MSPIEVASRAVKAQINGNKDHGWGQDDSLAVIKALWEDNCGKPMDEGYAKAVARFINPSACRQWLESDKVALLNKSGTKKARTDGWFAEFK